MPGQISAFRSTERLRISERLRLLNRLRFNSARSWLEQNFPHPFNPATKIIYSLPAVMTKNLALIEAAGANRMR